MRARYSAFVRGDRVFLLASWHASTRPAELDLDAHCRWLGLEVRQHRWIDAGCAEVEFVARWRLGGRGQRLHEISRFKRDAEGRWFYVDGQIK